MQSNGTRILALLVTLAVIVGLFFAFKGGDDDGDATTVSTDTTATTTTTAADDGTAADKPKPEAKASREGKASVPVIAIVGGQPKAGVAELDFDKGDEIRFAVDSDTADEIHVHGYDVEKPVEAGSPAVFGFPADLEGVFEVELHGTATQIAELTVNP